MKYSEKKLYLRCVAVVACTSAIALSQNVDSEKASLEKQKLKAETAKLETENRNLLDPWASWIPRITAIAGVLGTLGAVFKYVSERRKDREQRIDQDFGNTIGSLASDHPQARVAAAVSIVRFAGAQFGERRRLAIDVLLAELRISPTAQEQRILAESFSRALDQVHDYPGLNASEAVLSFRTPHGKLGRCAVRKDQSLAVPFRELPPGRRRFHLSGPHQSPLR